MSEEPELSLLPGPWGARLPAPGTAFSVSFPSHPQGLSGPPPSRLALVASRCLKASAPVLNVAVSSTKISRHPAHQWLCLLAGSQLDLWPVELGPGFL